ncbi:hypothetical protein [Falsiroseomonas tokyonensis]|uniref:Uncharacterized protein n=1 Tax=Falsiroseomonas tokyonensis TaxID=430521 RepID=A0ABV7C1I4_9PROT|nr:hypothetical protein [Falsiroseomonas tokyonensis]MBU8541325.1 hypothetical protein [Falsiroseomonas tokyonensis]
MRSPSILVRSTLCMAGLGMATLAALASLTGPAEAQSNRYCNNRLEGSTVLSTVRPGGGYGVMFIDYTISVRNETAQNITALVSISGLERFSFSEVRTPQSVPARANVSLRIGSFSGTAGSQPPSAAAVQSALRITC